MSKKVKKGKNAQRKKSQRRSANTSTKTVSVAQQRQIYEEETPRAELGEGVRVRSKGTTSNTMSLGVKVLVGIMAFTMLTMMGVVSYSSLNDFDIVDWLTGEDVAPGQTSETNSKEAYSRGQRAAVDATNKFDGFFVLGADSADAQPSGITLTDVTSDRQTSETIAASKKHKEEADEKRQEILDADKEKIASLKEKKDARTEAKTNNPMKRFSDGLSKFRDEVAKLFSGTIDGLTGKNRADEQAGDQAGNQGQEAPVDEPVAQTDEAAPAEQATTADASNAAAGAADAATEGNGSNGGSEAAGTEAGGESGGKSGEAVKPLTNDLADSLVAQGGQTGGKQSLEEALGGGVLQ